MFVLRLIIRRGFRRLRVTFYERTCVLPPGIKSFFLGGNRGRKKKEKKIVKQFCFGFNEVYKGDVTLIRMSVEDTRQTALWEWVSNNKII